MTGPAVTPTPTPTLSSKTSPMTFPGTVLTPGSKGAAVLTVQQRLNKLGCGPIAEDGTFGAETQDAVELFQARSQDTSDAPLKIDGTVRPMTWAALFGAGTTPTNTTAPSQLLAAVLQFATGEVGTMEDPLGSNRGPRVDQYLRAVGLDPAAGSFPWCAAFIYFCFQQAANTLNVPNPAIKDAGVLDLWNRAGSQGIRRIAAPEAATTPSVVQPGCRFVITTDSGNGHTGLVEQVAGVRLTTIEGNTNLGGSPEGIGVFRRTGRTIATINRGFIQY
jgi:peptidoglycan hydrolase-like protein with peptidoglycan-binding domain